MEQNKMVQAKIESIVNNVARRAHYLAVQMIYQANHRIEKDKGDPKVGGHASSSSSALHILGALHLVVKTGFDFVANKPHASPADHAYNYLMDLFLNSDGTRMNLANANQAMMGLRKFSKNGEPVFQSYHSVRDSDHHNFFPSGTVGIPPVVAGYMALAYRYAKEQGYEVPDAHFWAVCGDSEFREGSMYEAIPDFAERELGNVTWILDYNRQSLDGHRITNKKIMQGTDAQRIERTMVANGWKVIQVRHGNYRKSLFKRPKGPEFQKFLEEELEDFQLQALLLVTDAKFLKENIKKDYPNVREFIDTITEEELKTALHDMGGHDIMAISEALLEAKKNTRQPTMVIAHTIKGWNLKMAAQAGNHSALPHDEEMAALKIAQGLTANDILFARFDEKSNEGLFCKERGNILAQEMQAQHFLKKKNQLFFKEQLAKGGVLPPSLEISTKMANYPHTQWMLGQLTAKLIRIATTALEISAVTEKQKPLTEKEKPWKLPGELFVSMAPDVGTSTNLNPAMDGKIFGAQVVEDFEAELQVKDDKLPDLVPSEDVARRFIRFEIAEGNVMSCMGAFGKLRDTLGIPVIPLMTVYDFFIKRAMDQYFYNLYWKSSFICVGTPAGVTLSTEGAQHGWKSDFQIPQQITWEPFFCQELDWILCDAVRRHLEYDNEGRTGVLIRGVTRGVDQKDMMRYLKMQTRFKTGLAVGQKLCRTGYELSGATNESEVAAVPESEILEQLREDVLAGAYYLIDHRNYAGYSAGDNVVHLFAMGSQSTEAIKASEELLKKGIYANVIVVTSPDLLVGHLGYFNNYRHLRENLKINGNLHLHPLPTSSQELTTLSGRRIPVVSVHDGEAGLLDNVGSIVGVKQIACAVRKHSLCGRPVEVYRYHDIDAEAVVSAALQVLADTAEENIELNFSLN
jgi:pyruvate dehydrogenase E1 component